MGTRTANSYYTAGGQIFELVLGADMAFKKEDVQFLQAAVNAHDHDGVGHGKAIAWASIVGTPSAFTAASHIHDGVDGTPKLLGANTHQTPDTDVAVGSLHHTIGVTATSAAAGNHTHSTVDPVVTGQAFSGFGPVTLPTVTGNTGKWRFYKSLGGTTTLSPFLGEALIAPGATAASATNATYSSPNGESTGWNCNGTNWVCF